MCIECLIGGKSGSGQLLLKTQKLFDSVSRDLMDEAEENFSVKFELCYTIGTQKPVDLSPERWTTTQAIILLVGRYALRISKFLLSFIEVIQAGQSGYRRIRLLRKDAENMLLELISSCICRNKFPVLLIRRLPPETRQAAFHYIQDPNPSAEVVNMVENSQLWNESTKGLLLLTRGLIAGGVLRFALTSKRWKVRYGLDASRSPATQLAVPYQSKDNPSSR